MSEYISFIVSSWQEADSAMRWKVHNTRSAQDLCLPDATFVVRTWIEDDQQVVRCLIRHVQSGRKVQFQSGHRAIEFIRAWMASGDTGSLDCAPAAVAESSQEADSG